MAVFFYDLLRTTRRGRLMLVRTGYGLALLAALGLLFARWFPDQLTPAGLFSPGPDLLPSDIARFGEQFAMVVLLVQLAAVVVLTPAYAAGAVAEERQRGTLDALRTTELTDREIVHGKLASRIAPPLGLMLTGLPVLTLVPFLGGVAPM